MVSPGFFFLLDYLVLNEMYLRRVEEESSKHSLDGTEESHEIPQSVGFHKCSVYSQIRILFPKYLCIKQANLLQLLLTCLLMVI